MRVYEYPDHVMLEDTATTTAPRQFVRFTPREYAWLRFYRFLIMRGRFVAGDLIPSRPGTRVLLPKGKVLS